MLLDRDGTTGVGDGCRGWAGQQNVAGGGEELCKAGGGVLYCHEDSKAVPALR